MTVKVPEVIRKDICLEYLNGASLSELADLFDYSRYTIGRVLKEANVPTRNAGGFAHVDPWRYYEIYLMYRIGYSPKEIAQKKDIPAAHVTKIVNIVAEDPLKYEEMDKRVAHMEQEHYG